MTRYCSVSRWAINERWQASGSRSTQNGAAVPPVDAAEDDRREVGAVEDLDGVAAGVLGGELAARALADPAAVILGVLELARN